ncbi:MAG: WYL domain-containing protein [Planctomycetaceae bacterium]
MNEHRRSMRAQDLHHRLREFGLSGLQEINGWILGFGTKAVVLGPDELIAAVRSEAEELAWYYQRATPSGVIEKQNFDTGSQ